MPVRDKQNTNRQHAVPQNVLDVEFKIIADLTMRQFFYLLIFGAFAYIAFVTMSSAFKWILILLFGSTGAALAFIPFQERGLDEWIVNFFKAMYRPNQMVWRKEPLLPAAFAYENIHMVTQEMITLAPTTSRRKLENYLDSYGATKQVDRLDIDVSKYVKQLDEVYKDDNSRKFLKKKTKKMPTAAKPAEVIAQPVVETPMKKKASMNLAGYKKPSGINGDTQ